MADVRAARYLTRFACIGPACEDHCCGGWQGIDVDAPTLAAYHAVQHPTLGPALHELVVVNDDPWTSPDEAATIPVPPGGACPFLTGARLCAIQDALGERLLPVSCDTFPRQATLVGDAIDVAGRLACPEVARLVLLADDALAIEAIQPDRRLTERARFWVEAPWSDAPPPDDPRHHYHLVRAQIIALLQQRQLSLPERMARLGTALHDLDSHPSLSVDDVTDAFAAVSAEAPHPSPRALAGERNALTLLLARIRAWVAMQGVPPRYRACLDRLRAGLCLPDEAADPLTEATFAAYASARQRYVEPYLAARPYLLENLLVNLVWMGNFPYHPEREFFEEYAVLAVRYGISRVHLAGVAAALGRLDDALAVEAAQAFEKYVDRPDYWARALRSIRQPGTLTQTGALTLDSLVSLLAV
ncbi:MAG: flagellin lysine-N-methylase [Chloroflexi bacterium]|nr:flagellin lysine-N-methylase [Chloroflexota bacterium]